MEKKELKRLYELVLTYYRSTAVKGICGAIKQVYYAYKHITPEQVELLKHDFVNRKITIFSKHWWNRSYTQRFIKYRQCSEYWWTDDGAGYLARISYLESIIKSLDES